MKTYINTMNKCLCHYEDCKKKKSIIPESEEDVFEKLVVFLAKLVNLADSNLLIEDDIKKGDEITNEDKNGNVDKVVEAGHKLGCPYKP